MRSGSTRSRPRCGDTTPSPFCVAVTGLSACFLLYVKGFRESQDATGHIINALSGGITILLVGYLGWRVRPAIGAIAAVLFAPLPYVFDIARTAGIDLPSIALTLVYIIFGFSVVRTGPSGGRRSSARSSRSPS